jgi:phosphopantothenoylcysteine decarboxylase/phosphopantothenate--cysteine ligase
MGYAIARAAVRRGAEVALISGPSGQRPPGGAKLIRVETAREMKDAVAGELKGADAVVMAAAVADYAPVKAAARKLDKSALASLKLAENPDILAWLGSQKKRPVLVGFAAESGMDIARAKEKLKRKGADLVVLNDISDPESGFDVDTNRVVLVGRDGSDELPLMTKDDAAWAVLDRVKALLEGRRGR